MANPFGDVVDEDKLRQIVKYSDKDYITQEDKALEAMNLINEYDKNQKAANYAETLTDGTCTLCLIYNATGNTLYYANDVEWMGYIGRTPYPTEIGNGQWAAFVHCHPTGDFFFQPNPTLPPEQTNGSHGAVVYRSNNCDYLIAWSVPESIRNKCYGDINGVGSFGSRDSQTDALNKLNKSDYSYRVDKWGYVMEVDIARGNSPHCRAILKLRT